MPAILPDFEYDIFISYRHKDNAYDGWVTEFVNSLRSEIQATFKEDISIYFDANPHDGLHENHEVDDSLREKLKCLILIPIVSQTYCDPKAFAWKHELVAFIQQARDDKFGLKTRLAGGNVASRVLPIKIHEIDASDKQLFESEVEGVMRSIDFIYKETGVNRPLRPADDRAQNVEHTDYRNQVNKVANAIKDILKSLATREGTAASVLTDDEEMDAPINTHHESKKIRTVPTVSWLYKLKSHMAANRGSWQLAAAILFISVAAFAGYWAGVKSIPRQTRARVAFDLQIEGELWGTGRKNVAVSPDGEFVVYVTDGIKIKPLKSDGPASSIPGVDRARHAFIAPDSKWIGFENIVGNQIMKVPLQGGSPVVVCGFEGSFNGANWYENEIVFAAGSAIYRVAASGGAPERIYPLHKADLNPVLWNPQLLPDRKTLLFTQQRPDQSWEIRTWKIGSTEKPALLVAPGRDARFLKTGHIAYTVDHRLYVSAFDVKTNSMSTSPQLISTKPIFENRATTFTTGSSQFDFSENGILVYVEQNLRLRSGHLISIDKSGTITPITREARDYSWYLFSPDGQSIVAEVKTDEYTRRIEVINTKLGTSTLFLEKARFPVWSSDNAFIIYQVDRNKIFRKSIDLSAPPELLFQLDSVDTLIPWKFSKDGRYLSLFVFTAERLWDIGYYDMESGKVAMLEHYNTQQNEDQPVISPDGKWLSWVSNYSGKSEVYVAPFPGPGPRTKISLGKESGFAYNPNWAPDQRTLYYMTGAPELWQAHISTSGAFTHEEPQQISLKTSSNHFVEGLDIHPDGNRFLGFQLLEGTGKPLVYKVIVNWEQELTK